MRAKEQVAVGLLIVLMFLDALTTYLVVVSGVGHEANMFLQFINKEPYLTFILATVASVFALFVFRFGIFRYVLYGLIVARTVVVFNNIYVLAIRHSILYITMPVSATAVAVSVVYTAYVVAKHRHEFRDIRHVFLSFT